MLLLLARPIRKRHIARCSLHDQPEIDVLDTRLLIEIGVAHDVLSMYKANRHVSHVLLARTINTWCCMRSFYANNQKVVLHNDLFMTNQKAVCCG